MNFHSAELLKAFKGKHRENVLSQTVNIGLKIADVFIENFKRRTLQFPGSDFQKKEVVQRYNYFKVAANPKLLQRGKKERMLNPTHGKKIKNSNQTFPLKRKKKSIHALKFVQKKPFSVTDICQDVSRAASASQSALHFQGISGTCTNYHLACCYRLIVTNS